ncbi:HAMP domain-containing sensor histidine kinase [Oceanimonas sp. CHS3-5]|uniref:sensor histidine kinase n=1 Tax=Oceanimonas sp. CHS3-5 TaxID=3068186 RepID=UPI00273D5C5A|nr:HAMP domain-containing sensor histidine kinase [Oceanimonas sp. CHS3-5]MDP5290991.1 HAMP domain-containing sensor histidine kinase [Oceanimonas sp. CHS3-5]
MSCVPIKPRFTTGLTLTLWYLVLMTLVTGGLLLAGDHLLGKRLLDKDRQLVATLLDNYQRISNDAGPDKLLHVLERDREFLLLSHYRVRFSDPNQQPLFSAGPALPANMDGQLSDGSWHQGRTLGGYRLQVALSSGPRQQDLARYRQTMLQLLLPMLLISLGLVAWLTRRTLRPIRALIHRIGSLQRDGLDRPVPQTASKHTELGQLTLLFNQQMARIHRLVSGLRHALDSAAHDLRTPLTRQRLSMEQALASSEPQHWYDSLLDCAEENQRMQTQLDYLLAITAAEQGLDPARLEPCELGRLLEEVAELYELAAEDKDISLVTELAPGLRIQGDPQALRQAFANLLDNAIKYTEVGGRVRLSARRNRQRIEVVVEDSGIGISDTDLPHILERLYRGDHSRHSPGHGLGLALVKAILDGHQAPIEVTSGRGSTRFCCTFSAEG